MCAIASVRQCWNSASDACFSSCHVSRNARRATVVRDYVVYGDMVLPSRYRPVRLFRPSLISGADSCCDMLEGSGSRDNWKALETAFVASDRNCVLHSLERRIIYTFMLVLVYISRKTTHAHESRIALDFCLYLCQKRKIFKGLCLCQNILYFALCWFEYFHNSVDYLMFYEPRSCHNYATDTLHWTPW